MKIRLNVENSRVIGDKVFITKSKAHSLSEVLKNHVNWVSKINHPSLGVLFEWQGLYSRK